METIPKLKRYKLRSNSPGTIILFGTFLIFVISAVLMFIGHIAFILLAMFGCIPLFGAIIDNITIEEMK